MNGIEIYNELNKLINEGEIDPYFSAFLKNTIIIDLYENDISLKNEIEKSYNVKALFNDWFHIKGEVVRYLHNNDFKKSAKIIKEKYSKIYEFVGGDVFFNDFQLSIFKKLEENTEDYSDDNKIYPEQDYLNADYDPLEKRKYCFVATELFGNINNPNVEKLRKWRDQKLLLYPPGKKFIKWYYVNGFKIALFVKKFRLLKDSLRFCLKIFLKFL